MWSVICLSNEHRVHFLMGHVCFRGENFLQASLKQDRFSIDRAQASAAACSPHVS